MDTVRTFKLQVPVNYDLEWAKAIKRGGSSTTPSDWIFSVGDMFPVSKSGTVIESPLVVNFNEDVRLEQVLKYAEQEKLSPAHPRIVFAVGEHHPNLPRERHLSSMGLYSPQIFKFQGNFYVVRLWSTASYFDNVGTKLFMERDFFFSDEWLVLCDK